MLTYGGGVSGESYGDSFFAEVRSSLLNEGITITLVRAFISYRDPSRASAMMSAFPSINRFFNWWSWPDDVDTTLTADTDIAYRDAAYARGGPHIMCESSAYTDGDVGYSLVDRRFNERSSYFAC
ncbi:hypothetical protein B0H10DRAFT_734017 [Mycena sp. CBHHK59/15]|nr:hypothetical protein B0H10DRAFT_734017 [Mycena sp. CBHHK59/15]